MQGINFTYTGYEWSYVVKIEGGGFDIRDCSFSGGARNTDQEIGGNGLFVLGSGNGSVRNCIFEGNQHHGLSIGDSVNILVEYCTAKDNLHSGIGFWESSAGTVRSCQSLYNEDGFTTSDLTNVTFEENIAQGNIDFGFYANDNAMMNANRNDSF